MLYVLHTGFALVLGFSIYGISKNQAKKGKIAWYDAVLALVSIVITVLQVIYMKDMIMRLGIIINVMDTIIGILMVIMVLELTRRSNGPVLPILSIIFILYARYGNIFKGLLGHKGYSWARIFSFMLTEEALYGVPIQASTRICFLFLVFSAFLMRSGAGNSFIDLSIGAAGKYAVVQLKSLSYPVDCSGQFPATVSPTFLRLELLPSQ